jgi:dipeptide/tripeptide permease
MFITLWLFTGLLAAIAYIHFANYRPTKTKSIFAIGLIIAACVYIVFALYATHIATWLAIEIFGICIYGAMGFAGCRGSLWWLVAGWGLHPVWDLLLHYFGPGAPIAPS